MNHQRWIPGPEILQVKGTTGLFCLESQETNVPTSGKQDHYYYYNYYFEPVSLAPCPRVNENEWTVIEC